MWMQLDTDLTRESSYYPAKMLLRVPYQYFVQSVPKEFIISVFFLWNMNYDNFNCF